MTYKNILGFSNLSSLSFENALLLLFFVSLKDLSRFSIAKYLEQLKEEFKSTSN